jgi:hypothetical protein
MDLEVNKPTRIKLLFNDCIEGSTPKFGKYNLYAIQNGDGSSEYSLFAPEELHKQLKQFKKDDELLVTKLAATRNGKIVISWEVKKVNSETISIVTSQPNLTEDFFYTAMETSFDEAVRLQQKFNGVNISQVAISLFIQKTSRNNHSISRG